VCVFFPLLTRLTPVGIKARVISGEIIRGDTKDYTP
jgi:hypothetical protein